MNSNEVLAGLRRLTLVVTMPTVAACGGVTDAGETRSGSPSPGPIARIVVAPASASMVVGATQSYTATITDSAGRAITGRELTWISTAPGVATVSPTGLVTAVGTAFQQTGTTTIIATADGISGSATATATLPTNPFVVGFTITPAAVVVGTASATATATARIMDVGPGVDSVRMVIGPPNGFNSSSIVCQMQRISGTRADGTWTCPLTFARGATLGRWAFQWMASDEPPGPGHNGNLWQIGAAKQIGATASVAVLETSADTTPPALSGFTIVPSSVALGTGTSTVLTARVSDAGTGVAQILVDVGDSVGNPEAGSYCAMKAMADPGLWSCTLSLPSFTKLGMHPVRSVEVVDKVGNARVYTNAQLFAAGFQGLLVVTP